MKKIGFVIFILLIFTSSIFAGEIYTYTDKDGNTVISNEPIPEKYETKAKKIEAYKRSSPSEIAAWEQQQKAATENAFRGWQNSQQQSSTTSSSSSSVQASRNQRADKLTSDAAARLRAVRDAGFNLPQANINLLEKAANVKAEQIRQGTDTPMTKQEDDDFYTQQKQRDLEWKQRDLESKQRDLESKQRDLEMQQMIRGNYP